MLEFCLHVLIMSAIFGIAAVSLNLQAGTSGLLNFGQIALFGIGAYAVAILTRAGLPWPAALLAGIGAAALGGFAIGRLGRDLAAEYWALATLAVAELVRLVALNEDWLTGGPQGIGGIIGLFPGLDGVARALATLALAAALLLATVLVARRLGQTQFGRVLRLMRENPDLATALGHDIVACKVKVLAIGGGMAGLAGGLYTLYLAFIGPDQLLPFETFLIWTMVVLGGLGNVAGAVVGALLVTTLYAGIPFLKDFVALPPDLTGSLRVFAIGSIVLAALMLKPQGLVPERLRRLHAQRP
ncbi:branched-chain amino acid ABC transporter permease [Azospirillum endophyticum]